jgi:hypothetical protein
MLGASATKSLFSLTLKAQIAALSEHGFVVIKRPELGITKAHQNADAHREMQLHLSNKQSSWTYSIWRLFNFVNTSELRHSFPLPVAKNSAIVTVLNTYVGHVKPLLDAILSPNASLVEFAGMASLPGSAEQQVHSDTSFQDADWCETPQILSVFVAMEDVAIESGPTCFYSGTHQKDFHDLLRMDSTKPKVYNPDGSSDEIEPEKKPEVSLAAQRLADMAPFYAPLDAGDIVIFDTKVLHFGAANTSMASRDMLTFSFQNNVGGDSPKAIEGFTYYLHSDLDSSTVELQDFPICR